MTIDYYREHISRWNPNERKRIQNKILINGPKAIAGGKNIELITFIALNIIVERNY